jgi:hypothetical protein
MILMEFLFHIQIMELERGLTKVENELKSIKKARKKEATRKEEEEGKRPKESTKDMVVRWMKGDGGQGCSNDAAK